MEELQPMQAARHADRWLCSRDGRVRPFWRALMFFVFAGLCVAASGMLLVAFLDRLWPGTKATLDRELVPPLPLAATLYAVTDTVLLLCSWLFLFSLDRRDFRTLGLWSYAGWIREFVLGAAMGAGLVGVVAGTLVAGGWVRYLGLAANALAAWPEAFGFAPFLLLPAAAEELIARGYIFQRLLESWGRLAPLVLLSVLFGLGHLGNPSATPLSTANTVLAGVLLAVAYLKTRALWMPLGLHWAWNAFMGPVLSLPVSGLRAGPPLFQVQIGGPAWLSGGTYGPEGSAILTVACLALTVWLWRTPHLAPSAAMAKVLEYEGEKQECAASPSAPSSG